MPPGWTGLIAFLIQGFKAVDADKVLEKGMVAVTEVSADVARETDKAEAVDVAEEIHEQVAGNWWRRCSKRLRSKCQKRFRIKVDRRRTSRRKSRRSSWKGWPKPSRKRQKKYRSKPSIGSRRRRKSSDG